MKTVVFYDLAGGSMMKVMFHLSAHRALSNEFRSRGVLLSAGPLGNPPEGAMAIFTDKESAEEFIKKDPFVKSGIVSKTRIVDWDDSFLG